MSDAQYLLELAGKLRQLLTDKIVTQKQIQDAIGVDQSTISRVLNGKRKRKTDQIVRLMKYVNMRIKPAKISSQIESAARDFLVQGGTETELVASIEHSAKLVSGRMGRT